MSQKQQVPAKRGTERPPRRAATPKAALVPSNDTSVGVRGNAEKPGQAIPRLLWRIEDVILALGFERRTFERLRSSGRFPKPDVQIGRTPFWRPGTIEAWIAAGGGR